MVSNAEIEAEVHRIGRGRNKHWDDPERGYESFPAHLKASLWTEARKLLESRRERDWLQNRTEPGTKLSCSVPGPFGNGKFLYSRVVADRMY